MAKQYLNLVEIQADFFDEVDLKIPVDFEEQAGIPEAYDFLLNHLKSKALSSRIQNLISVKADADKELGKIKRSLEKSKVFQEEGLDIDDFSIHYLKLRALVEKLRIKVPDLERLDNYPFLNMAVQDKLMDKMDFNYIEEKDLDSPFYEEMRNFTSSFIETMTPIVARPQLDEDSEEYYDLMVAMSFIDFNPDDKTREERLSAARMALDFSKYCIPAYLILFHDAEYSDLEIYALADKAIEYIEEFFGQKYIERMKGHMYQAPESANYMMLRDFHARALLGMEEYDKAVESMELSLEYGEEDELGIRYRLLTAYARAGKFKEARKFIFKLNDCDDVYWDFGKLLIEFLDKGKTQENLSKLDQLKKKYPRVWEMIEDEELELSDEEQKLIREDRDFELGYKYASWNQEMWWELLLA